MVVLKNIMLKRTPDKKLVWTEVFQQNLISYKVGTEAYSYVLLVEALGADM